MNATDALPPSPSRTQGASRESWQRESKAPAAAGDVVALFAEMVSRAAERLDGTQPSGPDTARGDDDATTRQPSPDEMVAGMASLPAARAPAAAANDSARAGADSGKTDPERGATAPDAGTIDDRATGSAGGAAMDPARHGRRSPALAGGTAAPDAGQFPAVPEDVDMLSKVASPVATMADDGRPGGDALPALTTGEAAGRRDLRDATRARIAGAAEQGSSARSASEPGSSAAARAAAAAASATPGNAATTAAVAAAASATGGGATHAASAATANGASALDRSRPTAARRGAPDGAAYSRGGAPASGRSGIRSSDTSEVAPARSATGATQGAAGGEAAGATGASPTAQVPLTIDAGSFASAMDAAGAAQDAAMASEPALHAHHVGIDIPVHDEAFAEAFARQATQLVVQGSNRAEIQLMPRELGPVRIAIEIDVDAASLEIAADRHETRAAIEASMPTLRQLLADHGVRLADWRVAGDAADRRHATAGDSGANFGSHAGHGGTDGGGAQGSARGLPNPGGMAGRETQGGSGTRAGGESSTGIASSRPTTSRGGNRLDLFA